MGTFMAATKKWFIKMDGFGWSYFLPATKKVAMDEDIFWPQLKGWLWMKLFSSRN